MVVVIARLFSTPTIAKSTCNNTAINGQLYLFCSPIQLQTLVIVIVFLSGIMSVPGSCGQTQQRRNERRSLTDTQCLHQLRHRYLFVVNVLRPSNNTFTDQITNSSILCPWTWAIDEDVDRIPRFLVKAECRSCDYKCRAVFYSHTSLVQRCTRKRRGFIQCIWKRMERTLPIAYVFE